jgi:ATPase subunit of ABC transporter with duplicated ATPase domains
VYEGNYSTWLTEHQKRIDLEQKKDVALSKQIDQELKWIQQTPKARQSKNKARVKAYEQLLEQARVKPFQPGTILIPPGPRLGKTCVVVVRVRCVRVRWRVCRVVSCCSHGTAGRVVAEAERLRKQIEDRVLIDDFSFSLKPGAIVGTAHRLFVVVWLFLFFFVLRASCFVLRASCFVLRASCFVLRASCFVLRASLSFAILFCVVLNKPGRMRAGVIGPNGAGKTTLLNILSGEDKDFEGDLKIGESVTCPPPTHQL